MKRYRIAFENDESKLSDEAYSYESPMTGETALMFDRESNRVEVPTIWLRSIETELPEPGHVWWRHKTGIDYRPGLLREDGKLTVDAGSTVSETQLHMFEILPAHTTPPDAIITKGELFGRLDEHGATAYARRWEDLTGVERARLADAGLLYSREGYNAVLRLASLPTLRSAEEFTDAECGELRQAYIGKLSIDDADMRAVAAKAIEIAKRSTS